MIDISRKAKTLRTAVAEARVTVQAATIERIRNRDIPKGDPLEVARVAGVQAAKNTASLIPYCHPLPIEHIAVDFALEDTCITVTVSVTAIHRTGVEMEAMTGASVAALTLYDMVKMLDQSIEIERVRLLKKRGGKSTFPRQAEPGTRVAVLILSDSVAEGVAEDRSGRLIAERMTESGYDVTHSDVLPDDVETIQEKLIEYANAGTIDIVLTTGGTGLGPRDHTPEALAAVSECEIPGLSEAMRNHGVDRTPYAMLSRGRAGIRGSTLIINLPGSTKGVEESLDALLSALPHALRMMRGEKH